MNKSMMGLAAVALCGAAGSVYAQPAVFEDIGTLSNPGTVFNSTVVNSGEIKWLRMVVPAISAPFYLDIVTSGSGITDGEIGVYRADGTLVASDDDDGPGAYSALSFGAACDVRPGNGGLDFNGRDGALLAAGTYYVAMGAYNVTFGATDFNVTTASLAAGNLDTTFTIGNANPPVATPPTNTALGAISTSNSGTLVDAAAVGAGEFRWFSFTLSTEVSPAAGNYLDINTDGSFLASTFGPEDTYINLYNSSGARIAFDDDDGPAFSSQLSFGSNSPRPAVGNGAAPAGQDGSLPAGTYYLSIAGYAGTNVYGICNFDSSSANPNSGTVDINFLTDIAGGGEPGCGSADFNGDGDVGTDADIEAFFSCLAGNCCPTCGTADFNADGDVGTDADIEAFFRVLAGGNC